MLHFDTSIFLAEQSRPKGRCDYHSSAEQPLNGGSNVSLTHPERPKK